jgi:hypothetical protein
MVKLQNGGHWSKNQSSIEVDDKSSSFLFSVSSGNGWDTVSEKNLQHYPEIKENNLIPGANPTTVSYNASALKNYNATSSLARFENKNSSFYVL